MTPDGWLPGVLVAGAVGMLAALVLTSNRPPHTWVPTEELTGQWAAGAGVLTSVAVLDVHPQCQDTTGQPIPCPTWVLGGAIEGALGAPALRWWDDCVRAEHCYVLRSDWLDIEVIPESPGGVRVRCKRDCEVKP